MIKGDKVNIVGGKYKGRKGVFLRKAGLLSAAVSIDGDSVKERTLRLKSIEVNRKGRTTNTTTKEDILKEIADLSRRLKDLELKIKYL